MRCTLPGPVDLLMLPRFLNRWQKRVEDFHPYFVASSLKKKILRVSRKIITDKVKQARRLYTRKFQWFKTIATGRQIKLHSAETKGRRNFRSRGEFTEKYWRVLTERLLYGRCQVHWIIPEFASVFLCELDHLYLPINVTIGSYPPTEIEKWPALFVMVLFQRNDCRS